MKKSIWTKRCADWNGLDLTKYIGILTVIIYGIMGVIIFWGSIVSFFKHPFMNLKKIEKFFYKKIKKGDSEEI